MDEVMPGREGMAPRARMRPGTPRQMLRAWRWWRCDVTERATQDDVDRWRRGGRSATRSSATA
jgi:hypothetical protein